MSSKVFQSLFDYPVDNNNEMRKVMFKIFKLTL